MLAHKQDKVTQAKRIDRTAGDKPIIDAGLTSSKRALGLQKLTSALLRW